MAGDEYYGRDIARGGRATVRDRKRSGGAGIPIPEVPARKTECDHQPRWDNGAEQTHGVTIFSSKCFFLTIQYKVLHPNMTGSEEESGKAPAARTEGDSQKDDESGEQVVSRQDQRKAFEEERKVLLDK